MKNKNIYVSILILIIALAAAIFLGHRHVKNPHGDDALASAGAAQNVDLPFTFTCEGGKSLMAVFHLPENKTADFVLSDGRTINLTHIVSKDGARYQNADGSMGFWNQGDNVYIQEGGKITYNSCVMTSSPKLPKSVN